jgi:hypothetical protein
VWVAERLRGTSVFTFSGNPMPASVTAENTTTPATLGVAQNLTTFAGPTGGGCFVLKVDTVNVANGETLTLTLQSRARVSTDTRTEYQSTFAHIQSDPIKSSPMIIVPFDAEVIATIRQDGGVLRAFPWSLIRVDA